MALNRPWAQISAQNRQTPDPPTGGITAQRQSILKSVSTQPRPEGDIRPGVIHYSKLLLCVWLMESGSTCAPALRAGAEGGRCLRPVWSLRSPLGRMGDQWPYRDNVARYTRNPRPRTALRQTGGHALETAATPENSITQTDHHSPDMPPRPSIYRRLTKPTLQARKLWSAPNPHNNRWDSPPRHHWS